MCGRGLTCVRPPVSLQLVAPGEALPAEHPVADEGPLTTVPAQVGPKVGRLAVNFAAADDVAYVLLLLPQAGTPAWRRGGWRGRGGRVRDGSPSETRSGFVRHERKHVH